MKGLIRGLVVVMGFCYLAGCANVVGQWETVSVEPKNAKLDYKILKASFCCKGTYECTAEVNGKTEEGKGKYTVSSDQLTLKPEQGTERVYQIELEDGGKTLDLTQTPKSGSKVEMEMKKISDCCGKCKEKCKGDCAGKCEEKGDRKCEGEKKCDKPCMKDKEKEDAKPTEKAKPSEPKK